MTESFKTIYKPAEIELFEKKSRFIGHAFPVESEQVAQEQILITKKLHAKANHNCFAYQIGTLTRQSDDGEPSGTAGMPILDYLRHEGIQNTLIIVTRYFGGTLLGTGGLVRAYSGAAKEAAVAAGIIEKQLFCKFSIVCPYDLSGKLQYEILSGGHIICDTVYTDSVEFIVLALSGAAEDFCKHITNISSAIAKIKLVEKLYCAYYNGEFIIF